MIGFAKFFCFFSVFSHRGGKVEKEWGRAACQCKKNTIFAAVYRIQHVVMKALSIDRFKILSSSALKLIACAAMLSGHITKFYFYHFTRTAATWPTAAMFTVAGRSISFHSLLLMFGRFAFPIYVFLLVVGFEKTRNRKKYGLRLFILALLSELPYNLMITHSLSYPMRQNVIFTLFIGFLGMCALEYFRKKPLVSLLSVAMLFLAARLLRVDYGSAGFCFIMLMYGLRNLKPVQCVVAPTLLPMKAMVFLSFMVIYMYNGAKGFIQTAFWKYFFYLFYPAHLIGIMLIEYALARGK